MNTLEKEFVPYEQALALKELGFPQDFTNDGIWYYVTLSSGIINSFCWTSGEDEPPKMFKPIIRPTCSQAFRWFDENTELKGFVVPGIKEEHFDWLIRIDWEKEIECQEAYSSRIEAELACLRKLIEIVRERN